MGCLTKYCVVPRPRYFDALDFMLVDVRRRLRLDWLLDSLRAKKRDIDETCRQRVVALQNEVNKEVRAGGGYRRAMHTVNPARGVPCDLTPFPSPSPFFFLPAPGGRIRGVYPAAERNPVNPLRARRRRHGRALQGNGGVGR